MQLEKAHLPVPQFDQIQLDTLKQDIEKNIQAGQRFLDELDTPPSDFAAQHARYNSLISSKMP